MTFEESSGNGFCRYWFCQSEREQLETHLTLLIYRLIKSRGLKQVQAGEILGIKQAPTFR
jgi:predicted XRE-type DNA-binding protein